MKVCSAILLALILVGCGAAASLPPQENTALNQNLQEATWVSNVGDHSPWVFSTQDNTIIVSPSTPQANYVHGAYLVSIPDTDHVTFETKIGMLHDFKEPVVFQLFAQKGLDFALLGQVPLSTSNTTESFQVDLTAYRGQELILILGVAAIDQSNLTNPVLWSNPQITHP